MLIEDLQFKSILPYNKKYNYYVQLESIARYQFALDFLESKGLKDVLDVGCYNGFGCEIMARSAESVHGLDINKRYINLANLYKEKLNLTNTTFERLDVGVDNMQTDKKFDLITCFDTIAHVDDDKNLIRRIYNRLTDDGYALISVPCERFEPMKPDGTSAVVGHKHFYEVTQIKKMFTEAGFEIVDRLGQATSNVLLNLENFIIRKYDYPERKVKSYHVYEKENMQYFARLIAYPNTRDIEDSYSIFLIVKKAKKQ